MNKFRSIFLSLFLIIGITLSGCSSKTNEQILSSIPAVEQTDNFENAIDETPQSQELLLEKYLEEDSKQNLDINSIPKYDGEPFVIVNDNVPFFSQKDLTTTSFEHYSELDELGRCGVAFANIGIDIMPTEKRGNISNVKPSAWHSVKYENVDGKSLYNRCHLIGFQLSAENANEKNLITGTRYLNVTGMLPFENMIADYVKETNNHVLYRVTPIFKGDNLIADGVLMEAKSVEDNGESILFNVFVYNVQPGITIDYKTGESHLSNTTQDSEENNSLQTQNENIEESFHYILNTNSKKIHKPNCRTLKNLKPSNRTESSQELSQIKSLGYVPCKVCNPS